MAFGRICSMKKLFFRTISSPASERSPCKAGRIPNLSQWSQRCGTTIASMYAIPFMASRCRLAQSKPRAEPQSWMTRVTPLAHIQGLEQGVEVAAVLDEAIRAGAAVRQLVGVAHADQVRGDAAAQRLQVRQHVAPEVRRGGVAVQQHDGVARSRLYVRHRAAED